MTMRSSSGSSQQHTKMRPSDVLLAVSLLIFVLTVTIWATYPFWSLLL